MAGLNLQCGGKRFEQVDRRAVGNNHFAGRRTYQGSQLVPEPCWQLEPSFRIPTAYQADAPLLRNNLMRTRQRRFGTSPKGIAVQIDHAIGQRKCIFKESQPVALIEPNAIITTYHPGLSN